MTRRVENYILEKITRDDAIHMTLLDPETTEPIQCAVISKEAEQAGTAAIMMGSSTLASNADLDEAVVRIKDQVKIPIILFPNNISGISKHADAIWFMSLLNSSNTYYIIDVQALTARLVRQYGLEAIPMGYIIVGEGGAAGFVGHARPIDYRHPELALGYSLAAETLGMHFVYLEAGSGAREPVPTEMIKMVKSYLTVPLIVGGGIRDGETARRIVRAGADVIVTGTLVEETDQVREKIEDIVHNIKNVKR